MSLESERNSKWTYVDALQNDLDRGLREGGVPEFQRITDEATVYVAKKG